MDCEVRRADREEIEKALKDNPDNVVALQLAIDLSDGNILMKIINAPLISEYDRDTNTFYLDLPRKMALQLLEELGKALTFKKEDFENALNTSKQDRN